MQARFENLEWLCMISAVHVRDVIWRNVFLVVVIGIGVCSTVFWAAGYAEYAPFSVAFIIAGAVGVYMMVTTYKISGHLHERLNETNVILSLHTNLLQEIGSSLKEVRSTLKDLASSQKEMSSTLKDISHKLDK